MCLKSIVCVTYSFTTMNGEMSNEERNGVDKMIVDRLGERQRKLDRMSAWEKAASGGQKRNLRLLYAAISVAACIALVVVVNPFLNGGVMSGGTSVINGTMEMTRPDFSTFRAALPELLQVEQLIDAGEYYKALDIVEAKLEASDKKVKKAEKEPLYDDEEWMYEYKAEKLLNAELRWTYIYLLVMVECDRTAVKELKKYLEDEEFCLHKKDADAMMRALK